MEEGEEFLHCVLKGGAGQQDLVLLGAGGGLKQGSDPISTTRVGLEGVGWPHMAPDVPKDGQNPIRTFLRASNPDPINTPRITP